MSRRFALAVLCLAAAPAWAQTPSAQSPPSTSPPSTSPPPMSPPPAVSAPRPATVRVSLQTSQGPILLELEKERAPITTANFLRYVDAHRLDGATIYRAVKVQEGYGLVQGGLRNDPKKLFPPIALEPTSKTGLSHLNATISMARAAPGSATMDFFITVGDQPSMDADPTQPGDNLGFAAFGHVIEGMDLVKHLLDAPTSPDGPAAMKGQMLVQPIRILAARRVD